MRLPVRAPVRYAAHMCSAVQRRYFRPVACPPSRPGARSIAGGSLGFMAVEVLSRQDTPQVLPTEAALELYPEALASISWITEPRISIAGINLGRPVVMGILNATSDSFSDGGSFEQADRAVAHAMYMAEAGAQIIDIGGESTRPGAEPVSEAQELERTLPVIEGLVAAGCPVPLSIDTRKAGVARAALRAGAVLFNDVSALTHDPLSLSVAPEAVAVCLMHSKGEPKTMQRHATYENVVLDVYDYLAERVATVEAEGISRNRIFIDPGIGFGKTQAHNLALLRGLSVFHALGCPLLLGVSRKKFIGTLSGVEDVGKRVAGSIAAGLHGLSEGAQVLRVHDVAETVQAVQVWEALQEEQA